MKPAFLNRAELVWDAGKDPKERRERSISTSADQLPANLGRLGLDDDLEL